MRVKFLCLTRFLFRPFFDMTWRRSFFHELVFLDDCVFCALLVHLSDPPPSWLQATKYSSITTATAGHQLCKTVSLLSPVRNWERYCIVVSVFPFKVRLTMETDYVRTRTCKLVQRLSRTAPGPSTFTSVILSSHHCAPLPTSTQTAKRMWPVSRCHVASG